MRHCKTCKYLRKLVVENTERKETDYIYYCTWRTQATLPWAESYLKEKFKDIHFQPIISPRHIDGDWSEEMDCEKWEGKS